MARPNQQSQLSEFIENGVYNRFINIDNIDIIKEER